VGAPATFAAASVIELRVAQIDEEVRKIDRPDEAAKWWHRDGIDERRNDFTERRADDDACAEIENTTPPCKLFKFVEH
jgi:hypothetical protein